LDRSFFALSWTVKHFIFNFFFCLWYFLDALLQHISLDFFYYIY
jgi:hypothetical protein